MMGKKSTVKGLEQAKVFRIKSGTFINPKFRIEGTGFVNVSTYPTKIEIDLELLNEHAYDYLSQIAYNIGMSASELKDLLLNYDSDTFIKKNSLKEKLKSEKETIERKLSFLETEDEGKISNIKSYIQLLEERINHLDSNGEVKLEKNTILFRISIPFWRMHEGCYCGDIYVSKEDFFKGILIFNKNFGRFCINILPQHKSLLEDYYNLFIKMLEEINMDDRAFFFACPEKGNRAINVGHFCTVCLKNKYQKIKRKIAKEVKYYIYNPVKRKDLKLTRRALKIKNTKKLIEIGGLR